MIRAGVRVGIDVTPLLRARTGIAVCTELLVEAARAEGHVVTGLVSGWRRFAARKPLPVRAVESWGPPRLLNPLLLDVLRFPTVESLLGPTDVFVATNYAVLPARRATNVALIHDVGRLTHPHLYGRRQVGRARHAMRRIARFADVLVTPTSAVADEIVQLGVAPRDRIHVVPWFARKLPPRGGATIASVPADRPFLLCVATLERRKNVPRLVRVFRSVARQLPHRLVVVGGRGPDAAEAFAAARGNGIGERIHFLGHVDGADLAALYCAADVVVCPSLYEGFGLTLLEAMSYGCPVVATDIPAHREVAGDAVRLVPAGDDEAFARGLVEVAGDAGARLELRDRGLARSRRFCSGETGRRFCRLLAATRAG